MRHYTKFEIKEEFRGKNDVSLAINSEGKLITTSNDESLGALIPPKNYKIITRYDGVNDILLGSLRDISKGYNLTRFNTLDEVLYNIREDFILN